MIAERSGVLGRVREQIVDAEVGVLLATMYSALRVRYGWPPIEPYSRSTSASPSGLGCSALRRAT